MSKKAKVVLAVVATVVVLPAVCVSVGYMALLKPASPEAVCENFVKISEGTEYEGLMSKETCLQYENESRENSNAGIVKVATVTKCQAGAKDMEEFAKCAE